MKMALGAGLRVFKHAVARAERPSRQAARAFCRQRLWRTIGLLALALAGGLCSARDVAAQCQNTFTAVPLNVQQTYTIVTDATNTGTFAATPCDPYGKGVFDTFAHGSLPEQAEEGPIAAGQIIGTTYGNYYVGGTPGAEYIQFTPTSNPGFGYVNIVTYYVKSPLLGVITNTITFTVNAAPLPTVTAVSANAGPTTGGTSFTLTGTNLTGATAVSFGGTAATSYTVNSATSITVTSPAHASGLVDITVTTPNGISATSTSDQFTFVPAPTITSLTPTFGTTAGGTVVTLTGTNLSSATQILFNGVAGTSISSTATSATVTTPAHAAGQVDVTLTTVGGTSALNTGDHYTFIAPPTAGASSATVAYNSSANAVTLNTSGGPTSVTVASTPSHGTAIASGTTITYTPTTGFFGSDSFTYTATNSVGTSTAATVTITVTSPAITVTPTTLTSGTFGTPYSQTLSASGGQSPYTFTTTLTTGALPTGLSLSSAGVISGTPTAGGTFTFTVSGTDSSTTTHANFTSTTITLVVAPVAPNAPTIGTATAGNLQASVAFSAPATNGGATITSYTATSSPGGFTATGSSSPLTVTGLTNGTAYTFTVTATNSAGTGPASAASNSVTPIGSPVAGASSKTVAYNSSSNTVTLNLSGGTPTSVAVASVASHGTATASGTTITYTPVTGYFGSDSFTYTATNGFGTSSAATVSVTVIAPTITVTPTNLPSGVGLVAYSQTLTATGGQAPYTFSTTLASGALPTGVTLSSAGVVSGTPLVTGTFTFTVTGTDSSTLTHASFTSSTITLIINSGVPLAPGAPTIGTATPGNAQATVTFTPPALNGGATITSYTVTSNPSGITASGSASPITVTGLTNGVAYTFTVTATNSAGTGLPSFSSNSATPIAAPIASATSATVAYGSSANPITLNLTGGAPTSVAVVAPGSHGTATASGTTISYTPATGYYGTDTFTFNATNGTGTSSTATATITISAPSITITPTTLTSDTVGSAYSQTLNGNGGQAPYTFATTVASGALPPGISLASTGSLTGTPTTAGNYTFTVSGTDSSTPTHASFISTTITLAVNAVLAGAPTIGTAIAGDAQATVSFTAPASNGGSPITSYTVTSSPGGITASGSGSPITVTGLTNGTAYTFTVTATNAAGVSSASSASNAVTPLSAPVAGATAATVAYNSSANPITLNLTGGTPTSVAISSPASHGTATASGTSITYTPATGYFGADSFTYTATNATGTSPAATASITVSAPAIAVTPTTLPSGLLLSPYSQTLTASGGQAPYTFSTTVASGSLPAGLSLSSTGAITGTPTTVGTSTFTVTGTDSSTATHATFTSATISLTITALLPGAPTIGTATAGNGQATVSFSPPSSNGGTAIISYTVTSSPGNNTGTGTASPITVTGLNNGTAYTFTVTATNVIGTGPASSPSNSVTPLAPPVAGAASATVAFNSSANPITLNLSGGTAASVAVASAASHGTATASGSSITYTPTTGYFGSDSFTYTATNISGTSSPATVSITVNAPGILVTPATLTSGTVGTAYSQTLSAAGGTAPYTFSTTLASGSLPAGLSLSASGVITGIPTAAGTFPFTVSGTDATTPTHASFTSSTLTLTIAAAAPGAPTIGTASLSGGQVSVTFTPPASNGGSAITSYTVTSSPGGITATGSGSPITVSGLTNGTAYTFTVTATNAAGTSSASAASNAVTPVAPPVAGAASATVAYDSSANPITLTLSGGTAASVAIASPANHGTATVSGTSITYTPTAGFFGPDSFTYTATNANGTSAPATVSLTVSAPTISVTPTTLPSATLATAYSQSLTAAGGQAPYTFSTTLASGSLPTGLSLSSAGAITGTPTVVGTSTFTVTGTDSSTASHASFTSSTISLTVTALLPGSPTIGTATAGNAQATVTFTAPSSTGGSAITGYTVTSSPGGVTATGTSSPITVTGLTNGTAYTFTVTATNAIGTGPASAASNSVTPIAPPVAASSSATVAYDATSVPITLSLSGGAPSSVAISSAASHGTATATGANITYTPTTGYFGTDSFTYTATNGSGTSSAATVTVTVSAPTITVTPTTLAAGTVGTAYSQTLTAAGGQAPYTFATSVASGALPAGLTLSSSGAITGTPTAPGTYTFTVSGTDSSTATHATFTSATISLTISSAAPGAPTIGSATAGDGQASVTFTAPASNGGSAITGYTVTSSPGGLTATGTTSPITVTGLTDGTEYTFTVTATNATGTSAASAASNSITPKAAQTITFTNPGTQSFNSTPTLSATASSSLAVTFSSTTTGVCTITTGGALTFVTGGTCTIAADQAGNSTYAAAPTVNQSFTVTATASGAPTIGTATAGNTQATVTFTAPASNGGTSITSYTVTSNPGGFTATGSGSPITVTGLTNGTAYTFTVTATNSVGTSAASAASNSITPSSSITAGATTATVAYNATSAPITLNLSGGAPTSVAVASPASHGTATASGTSITYTPATGYYGPDSFTYTATNSSNTSGPATVSITVSAPVISVTPTTLAAGTVNSAYSQILSAAGGKVPYTFSTALASGALPAGLSLSSSGVVSGTPTAGGTFTFTVTGTDSSTGSGPASFTSTTLSLTINSLLPGAPTIGTASSSASRQASVSFTPPASNGGSAITSYTVTSNPGGITATGSSSPITVTGLTDGTAYTFTITATNSAGTGPASSPSNSVTTQASQTITFANPGTQSFNSSPTLTATASSSLTVTFTSTTTGVCTIATGGALTFVSAGSCTIAANQAGNTTYSAAPQVTQSFTVSAGSPGAPTVGSASADNGQSTVSFTPPTSNGGSAITSYTVTSSPGGLTATGSGSPITITGLTNGTSYTFTVAATNATGTGPASAPSNSVTPSATVTATQAIASTALTQNHAATAFTPVAGGSGTAPLTYSVAPALPAGLALSTTSGAITGTPTAVSPAATYTVTVTDSTSATASATFSLTVNTAVSATTGTSPSSVTQGVAVTPFTPITGSGGTSPFTYTISPALPANLTINPSTGQITGTPTNPSAATTYTVTVTDANGATSTATFTLAVTAPLVANAKSITAAYNANGSTSTAIDLTNSITGGTPTSVSVATPPGHGLATVSGLVVTYTPLQGFNGADSFTYTASNSTSTSASATVSITVSAPTIAPSSGSGILPGGAIGVAYSQTITPTGGTAPYTFATTVTSGALPAGLTLSSTGVLSGTPTTPCTCTFTITGTDSSTPPATFTLTFSLTIVGGAPTVTAITPNLGLAAGGATVTLTGTNLTDTSIVSFGNVPAGSVTYLSATTLTAVVPPGTGVVDVTVTTAAGSSPTSPADQFTYLTQAGALSNPLGTAVDGNGNTFIADPTLGYIVEVPAGCASIACEKIIGGGLTGLTGVTVDSNGNLIVLSGGPTGTVTEFPYNAATNSYCAPTTIGTGLNLPSSTPTGVTVDDKGNLFYTDTANHTVVEEPYNTASGTYGAPITLTTGSAQSTPTGIATDANGDVFYADPGTGTINELVPGTSTPIVLASGVNAQSVTVDASGNVYYTDSVANTVTRIPFNGTAYGTPVVIATGLNGPLGLSVDDNGNILVANNGTQSLVKVTVSTPPSFTFAGTKAGATSTDSPQTATLSNIGTTALTFPPTSAANPALTSGYTLGSASTCPQVASTSSAQTVSQGSFCTYAVSFSPAEANIGTGNSPDTGSLTATDDNLNVAGATQAISLTGVALADDVSTVTLTLNPASPIVFGRSVAITANVRDTSVPATVPTGSVTFTSVDAAAVETTPASAVTLANGSASVPVFKPAVAGTYTLTGVYTGAVGDISSSTGTTTLVVSKATPALAYTPSPATQAYGTAITAGSLDATAVDANGAAIPGTFVYTTLVNGTATTLVAGTTILPTGTYTITATFTPTDTADYTSGGTVTANYTVTDFLATVTLSNLSYNYNGQPHSATATTTPANLPVTITYNGSSTPPTQGGSYPVIATIQDANYTGTATGTLVIARVPVDSIVFVDNPDPVLTTTPVTLTATVSSSLGIPTGTVNYNEDDINIVIATAPLVNGVATYTTSAEPLGIYHLSATYLGDANFLPLTSATNSNTVLDFSVAIDPAAGSTGTATAQPGGTANYEFVLAPAGSPTFLDPVTFTISGQPEGSTYTITPSTIPAGSGPTPVALAITVPQNSALLRNDGRKLAPFVLALLLLPFAGRMRRAGKHLSRALSILLLLIASLGVTTGLTSCGGASGFYGGSPSGPKTYIITLTGTSGTLSRSTTVTLTVP